MTHKILVVDDDPISLRIIVDHLQSCGYITSVASNGKEGLQLLLADPAGYSVAIVDRMMIGLDGIGLLRKMKQHRQLCHIPVIMQTGESEPEEYIEAVKEGVFDYIYKPVDQQLLLYVVRRAIGS